MFGISFSEIVLILLISLVVFGPKQLPQIASKLGKLFFGFKHYLSNLKQEIYQQSGFNEFKQTKNDFLNTYQQIKNSLALQSSAAPTLIHPTCHEINEPYQPELDFNNQPELF